MNKNNLDSVTKVILELATKVLEAQGYTKPTWKGEYGEDSASITLSFSEEVKIPSITWDVKGVGQVEFRRFSSSRSYSITAASTRTGKEYAFYAAHLSVEVLKQLMKLDKLKNFKTFQKDAERFLNTSK